MVNRLGITHIYGDIGSFNSNPNESETDFFQRAIANIKVVGEDRKNVSATLSNKIFREIQSTKRHYFLGFSFDELNTEALFGSGDIESRRPVYDLPNTEFVSTHVNLTSRERTEIENRLPFTVIFPATENCTCYQLIREEKEIFKF